MMRGNIIIALALCLAAQGAMAEDEWTLKATPQYTWLTYKQSLTRDSMSSFGIFADAQYLEQYGISFGATSTDLEMLQGASALKQNNYFVSGRLNFTPDTLPGILTLRADMHGANNNDATNETNGVRVVAPVLSFLNYARSHYLDLGYALSRYGDSNSGNGTLTVKQWTPTVGLSYGQDGDWLQLRIYHIMVSNPARAQNRSRTDALEAKWTYFLAPAGWKPEQVQLSALFGKRIYAVDGDWPGLFNLVDLQRGGAMFGMQWRISGDVRLLISGGQDFFETQNSGNIYAGSYLYSSVSMQW